MRNPNLVNPASKIKRFKSLPKERYLSQDEIETVILSLPYGTFGDVIQLLVLTGARKSEIEGMMWEWIDWERKVVRLPDSKTGAGRVLYLSKPALDVLRGRKPLYKAEGYVFPSALGGHYVSTTQEWFRFRKQIDMEDVRLHDLRHTFASQAVNAGHSLAVIGQLLGHSDTRTTERYAHLDASTLVNAANDIGRGMA
jgi:integrase